MFVNATENFLEPFEKSCIPENEDEMKLKIRLEYSDKTPFLGLKLFSKASRKISVGLTNMFKVSERHS